MQPRFSGDSSLYAPWVAALERQQHHLIKAAQQREIREIKECQVSPLMDRLGPPAMRHRIGGLLIGLGTRLSGSATGQTDLVPVLGRSMPPR